MIGTTNPAKFARYRRLLRDALGTRAAHIVSPSDVACHLHIVEDGQTAENNARKKTQHIAHSEGAVVWTWALCLVVPGSGEYVEEVTVRDGLAAEVRTPIPSGYPLSAIMVDTVTGKRVCDLTEQEAAVRLHPVGEAVDRLVQAAFTDVNAS